jgi:hypothetical protein
MDHYSTSVDYDWDSPNRVHTVYDGKNQQWITSYFEKGIKKGKPYLANSKKESLTQHRNLVEKIHKIRYAHHQVTR